LIQELQMYENPALLFPQYKPNGPQNSKAHLPSEKQKASCERRVTAIVKGLGDRNVSLIIDQMTPNGLVYSDSEGVKTPPKAFYDSFLPTLASAQSEILELWCEKTGPKANTASARFNFTWFNEEGGAIQGGIYTDIFMFVDDDSNPEPLIQELQMYENPALLFPQYEPNRPAPLPCKANDHVACPVSGNMCSGNQCCPGVDASGGKTFPCPSASDPVNCQTSVAISTCTDSAPTPAPTPPPQPQCVAWSQPCDYNNKCCSGYECTWANTSPQPSTICLGPTNQTGPPGQCVSWNQECNYHSRCCSGYECTWANFDPPRTVCLR